MLLNENTHKCVYIGVSGLSDLPNCSLYSGNTDSYSCMACAGGYYLNSSKTCTSCSMTGCQTCKSGESASNPKCSNCKGGYYLNSSGECLTCSSKYGTNCATCDSDNCLSCKSGYSLGEDTTGTASCDANDGTFTCSDSNFMRIGNLCVTRKNMGDSTVLAISNSANVIVAGQNEYCPSSTNKCCWQGTTSGNCNDENGGYSGCTRTVCNWEAANAICANFNYAGKKWRLPTSDELSSWYYQSAGLGANGLQLCDNSSGYSSAKCSTGGYCSGSGESGNTCVPCRVWDSTISNDSKPHNFLLTAGVYGGMFVPKTYVYSLRCVTQMND